MVRYFPSVAAFSVLFSFFPAGKLDWQHNIQPVWIWNKETGFGTRVFLSFEDPTKNISGYKIQGYFYSFPSGKFYKNTEGTLLEYSVLAEGFYEYKKLGDEIAYYNGWRELYWKKPFSSYPKPGYYSGIIPLVSGDGNAVFFIDRNGNSLGIGSIEGRFAVDICYSTQIERIFVLFSGGEYSVIDEKGNPLSKNNLKDSEKDKIYFAKSCAISPYGDYYGIHYLSKEADIIRVYSKEGKYREVSLNTIIPNKVHFVINNSGDILLALKDRILLYNNRGKLIREFAEDMDEYYNPVFVFESFFVWGNRKKISIWNSSGSEVVNYTIHPSDYPYRFLPGRKNSFYLETQKEIRQFVMIDAKSALESFVN